MTHFCSCTYPSSFPQRILSQVLTHIQTQRNRTHVWRRMSGFPEKGVRYFLSVHVKEHVNTECIHEESSRRCVRLRCPREEKKKVELKVSRSNFQCECSRETRLDHLQHPPPPLPRGERVGFSAVSPVDHTAERTLSSCCARCAVM